MALDQIWSADYQSGMADGEDSPLKRARKKAKLSQEALAQAAGTTQPQIRRLEVGERKMTKQWAERLATFLGIAPAALMFDPPNMAYLTHEENRMLGAKVPPDSSVTLIERLMAPIPQAVGERNLGVYASVQGGSGEMTVFSNDPIDIVARPWYAEREMEAFGIVVTGDSMEPVYEAGEIVIVSPRAPLVKGKDAVFIAEPEGGDFRASLKRYRGQNDEVWFARQFNPPNGQDQDIEFDRDVWRRAFRVLGSYDG